MYVSTPPTYFYHLVRVRGVRGRIGFEDLFFFIIIIICNYYCYYIYFILYWLCRIFILILLYIIIFRYCHILFFFPMGVIYFFNPYGLSPFRLPLLTSFFGVGLSCFLSGRCSLPPRGYRFRRPRGFLLTVLLTNPKTSFSWSTFFSGFKLVDF